MTESLTELRAARDSFIAFDSAVKECARLTTYDLDRAKAYRRWLEAVRKFMEGEQ